MSPKQSAIYEKATRLKIDRLAVDINFSYLSAEHFDPLIQCEDRLFKLFMCSHIGTEMKAMAAREIGLLNYKM